MLIACPACASEYEIEGVLVGAEGRSVRCAACSETWFVGPERGGEPDDAWDAAPLDGGGGEAPEAPGPVVDPPMPPPRTSSQPSQRTSPRAPRARPAVGRIAVPRPSPALAAGLALFVILPRTMLGRATVVRAMPQSAGLFAAVGLPVNLRGVDLRDVAAFQTAAEGASAGELTVEGDLVGVARDRVAVAPLEIELRDAQDRPLHRWTVPPPRVALEPGETARFRASLPAPRGSQVVVRFTDPEAAGAASRPGEAAAHAEPGAPAPAAAAGHDHH